MKLTLAPGETRVIGKAGFAFYLIDAPGAIDIKIDGEVETLKSGQGIPSNGKMFSEVWLINPDYGSHVTIECHIATMGRGFVDNRMSGAVDVVQKSHNGLLPLPALTLENNKAKTVSGNAARARLDMYAPDTNNQVIWIGGAVGKGIPLKPGGVYQAPIDGAVTVLGTTGDVLYLAEVV